MMYPCSPEFEASIKRNRYKAKLSNLSDEKLINIYESIEKKYKERKIYLGLGAPKEWCKAGAAIDILRERHGENIVEKLTGIKQPKTLVGKILKFLFQY